MNVLKKESFPKLFSTLGMRERIGPASCSWCLLSVHCPAPQCIAFAQQAMVIPFFIVMVCHDGMPWWYAMVLFWEQFKNSTSFCNVVSIYARQEARLCLLGLVVSISKLCSICEKPTGFDQSWRIRPPHRKKVFETAGIWALRRKRSNTCLTTS